MKKQDIVNLIKYHVEKNDEAFVSEVAKIAREFDSCGDTSIAQYMMELISSANFYVPQHSYKNLKYLQKIEYSSKPLLLPNSIEEDIMGIIRAITDRVGLSKFLFYGDPGSGKTEAAYQISRILNRDILSVDFAQIVDSRLGETSKNLVALFDEISHVAYNKVIIVFDEIDSIVLDRINKNDLREMGRVTSLFLREMDKLNENIIIIATTNLYKNFDKALIRRFDSIISFDRYSRKDLIAIADSILSTYLKKKPMLRQNLRLLHKILEAKDIIPYPGDLKQIIKTAIAFSDDSSEYDYLRKIYLSLNDNPEKIDLQELRKIGFTTREIEILSNIPKSSISRKLQRI